MFAMPHVLNKFYDFFLAIISPPACAYCKKYLNERKVYCSSCFVKLQPVVTMLLPITTTRSAKIYAACAYREPIKSLIVAKSWSDVVASKQLADVIWQMTDIANAPCDFFVPVPLHWTRFAKRGFNQAEEIAKHLSKKNGKKVAHILKRVKRTPFQSGLSSEKRRANLQDAFDLKWIDISAYKDKHLIIVDDLMTTGATIRSCAKLLFQLKPASVSVVVASRVIPL